MLLCHALALHQRGYSLYVDALPFDGVEQKNLHVSEIGLSDITVPEISATPLRHSCTPGVEFDRIETLVGRLRLHLQGEDPVATLLADGMSETELNTLVVEAHKRTQELAG